MGINKKRADTRMSAPPFFFRSQRVGHCEPSLLTCWSTGYGFGELLFRPARRREEMQSQVTVRQFHCTDIAARWGRRQHQSTSVARRSALRARNQDDEPSPRAAHLAEVQERRGVLRIVGELVISGWDPGIA